MRRWALRPSHASDAQWMAELRAVVMRPDLQRLGRYDPVRVRRPFLDGFLPHCTSVVVVDGKDVGLVCVRAEDDAFWIEHFYLSPTFHGQGTGGEVLAAVMADVSDGVRPFRLNVLQGSPARRLYERHGFVLEHEDPIDVYLKAEPVPRIGERNSA